MSTKLILVLAAAAFVAVSSLPLFDEAEDLEIEPYGSPLNGFVEDMQYILDEQLRPKRSLWDAEEIPIEDDGYQALRQKRATCDALSFSSKWITVNHSACAIHCIAKGYKGGKCSNAICRCRK